MPAMVYMEQPLTVELEPFEGFYAFLLDLELLPRITRMFNLTLRKIDALAAQSDDLPPGSVNATFMLGIYFTTPMNNHGDEPMTTGHDHDPDAPFLIELAEGESGFDGGSELERCASAHPTTLAPGRGRSVGIGSIWSMRQYGGGPAGPASR